jgi:hypothetical protein
LNFSWIYYIARAKLMLDKKEIGRLTIRQFLELYQAYKDTFDIELILMLARKTYADIKKQQDAEEEWL